MSQNIIFAIIIGYFFGTVSFSAIWAKFYGIKLREIGSKNIGATNLARSIGWNKTLTPAILDGFKCFLAFAFLRYLFNYRNEALLLGMLFTAIGHIWPFWNKFYGGKGVAVSFGFLIATLSTWYSVTIIITFILLYKKTKIMTYSSVFMVLSIFIGSFFFKSNFWNTWTIDIWPYSLILALIVIAKHYKNFIRIIKKEEK